MSGVSQGGTGNASGSVSPKPAQGATGDGAPAGGAAQSVPLGAITPTAPILAGAEATEKAARQKGGYDWLRPFLKPVWPSFREVAVVSFFVNLAALATPIFVLQVYDRVVFHQGLSTLLGLGIGMALMLGFDFILRQARSRIMQTVALRLEAQVARRLFAKLNALPMQVLERRPAEFWHLLFRDVDVVRNTLSGPSAILVVDVPFSILFMAVIFILAPPLAWVLLVALVIFLILAILSGRAVQSAADAEKDSTIGRDGLLSEVLRGRGTVKALSLSNAIRPHWEAKMAEHVERSVYRGGRTDMFANLAMVMTIATTVGMTTVGALAIMEQNLTIGGLIAANMMAGRLLAPLGQLVGAWRSFASFGQSVRRLGEVFELEEDRIEATIAHPKPKGVIAAEELTITYAEQERPAVDGVTCGISPGGMTAIMGANGSGKSTLVRALQGLYTPVKGRATLDGADINQFSRDELAAWIGYLPQDTMLFAGTIRDNIIMGYPQASDAQILEAANIAQVHQMIADLPDGYATQVGEAGGRLSGGMRQRIALARALIGDPPVLILDEPSASLDRQAEEQLVAQLAETARSRTVIVVTHSPVMLQRCAAVVILDKGRIKAGGPAAEILPKLFAGKAATASQKASAPQTGSKAPGAAQPSAAQPSAAHAQAPPAAASSGAANAQPPPGLGSIGMMPAGAVPMAPNQWSAAGSPQVTPVPRLTGSTSNVSVPPRPKSSGGGRPGP